MEELKKIETWTFGKCELYHWIDILDICDNILEEAVTRHGSNWALACDLPENKNVFVISLKNIYYLYFSDLLFYLLNNFLG